jgi:L-ribulose-5-phosphate 3-epimerase
MPRWKIGLGQKPLNLPLRQLLPALPKLGAAGLELEATGDLAPAQLTQTGRRELRHLLRGHGLEVAAISCSLRRGLAVEENQEARLEYLRQALTLSYEMGPRVVVIEPGPLPAGDDDPRKPILIEALTALSRHGDKVGATLALEMGLESGSALAEFLAKFDTGGLGACLNPGNLLMHGHAPVGAARALNRRVALVHARDARLAGAGRGADETPLGQGDVDWLEMLSVLEEIDYRGWLTITRGGTMSLAEAGASVGFLRRLVP